MLKYINYNANHSFNDIFQSFIPKQIRSIRVNQSQSELIKGSQRLSESESI